MNAQLQKVRALTLKTVPKKHETISDYLDKEMLDSLFHNTDSVSMFSIFSEVRPDESMYWCVDFNFVVGGTVCFKFPGSMSRTRIGKFLDLIFSKIKELKNKDLH